MAFTGWFALSKNQIPQPPRRTSQSGQYAWNAGMFMWRAEIFLRETERLAPP